MTPGDGDTRTTPTASRRLQPERLAPLIQVHREMLRSHPEAQETHEAILSLLEGVAAGEITPAHGVRLLRHQALRVADVPATARLYRQAATDLERLGREVRLERPQR
jgi:hypothetical protein